jgi:NADH:ubiquinone oxidoreductase subunit 5 (subunit L)/multisubunit Na+/H+ antiporter MnhA subunit
MSEYESDPTFMNYFFITIFFISFIGMFLLGYSDNLIGMVVLGILGIVSFCLATCCDTNARKVNK